MTASATRESSAAAVTTTSPEVGPLVTQLAPDSQPVLTREVKVERHDVNLVA